MHWDQLLGSHEELTLPWIGGRTLCGGGRGFRIVGALPPEHGWHRFMTSGSRRATWLAEDQPDLDFAIGRDTVQGYVIEDRLIRDGVRLHLDLGSVFRSALSVRLVDRGLERFARASAARLRDGRWVFVQRELPLGPEAEVLAAFQDGESLEHVRGVSPALHLCFLWYQHRRAQAEARRTELRMRAERAARERRYERAVAAAAVRRELAGGDFELAARAALAFGGAQLLDVRDGYHPHERVVQFRFRRRRFECCVHCETLRVIDAGICLVDHATDERGDERFTLESLVPVIDEAIRTHQLVVFRHV